MLAEAAMMIPDTRQRLEVALQDLQSTLVRTAPLIPYPGLACPARFAAAAAAACRALV